MSAEIHDRWDCCPGYADDYESIDDDPLGADGRALRDVYGDEWWRIDDPEPDDLGRTTGK